MERRGATPTGDSGEEPLLHESAEARAFRLWVRSRRRIPDAPRERDGRDWIELPDLRAPDAPPPR